MIKLANLLKEAEEEMKCPVATQDITVNLEHRQKAIDEYGYGPLNPNNPNIKFWKAKADAWQLDSIEEAKSSRCNNCAAFNITTKMLSCIERGILSGEKEVPVNEFLKTDLKKLNSFLQTLKSKIKDSKVIKDVESIISLQVIDPYASISSVVSQLRNYFEDNTNLSQLFNQLINTSQLKLAEGDEVVDTETAPEPETDDTEGAEKDAWETIEAGKLGYCTFLKFKCAGSRTCDAWVVGGPIKDKK